MATSKTPMRVGLGALAKGGRGSFKGQLLDFVSRLEDFGNDELNALTADVFDGLVERTPKSSGEARAGWAIALNGAGGRVPAHDAGGYSAPRASDFAGVLRSAGWDDVRTIYNRVPYILKLEHGSSTQAPRGMVVVARRRAKTRRGRRM